MTGARAFKTVNRDRRCLWDYDPSNGFHSCHRPALPGRRLCHRHAGQKTEMVRRRRRNRAARVSRRVQRSRR